MSGFVQMEYDDWFNEFKPMSPKSDLSQLLADNFDLQDYMLETYDHDLQCVRFMNIFFPDHIWTYCASDEEWISNGYHYVNRMGYFITKKPRDPNVEYEINFEPLSVED